MAGPLRMPASGGSRNGRRQVLAALKEKKSTPARTPSGASRIPRRLAPAEATYSPPKKRKRTGDNDDFLDNEDMPSRPQQKTRTNVITPSSIAHAARQAAQVSLPVRSTPKNPALPHDMQARPIQKQTGNGAITPFRPKPKYRSSWYSNSHWGGSQSRPLFFGSSTAGPSNAPAGLVNLGNTCYLNAVLQSLFSLPTFPGAISAAIATGGEALASDGVLRALSNCLAQRSASSAAGRSAFSPEQVKAAVGRRLGAFRGSFQQDAHEFFCGLIEAVQAEILTIESKRLGRRQVRASETTDPSTRVFGFAVEHEITCTACNNVSLVTEQCTHLSLDLPESSTGDKALIVPPGLDSMLSSYFQEESVEKGCERCGAECVQHTVRHRIKRLPQILALHVKRFQVTFQQSTGTVTCLKIRDPVPIPTGLRVKSYCVEKPAMPLPPLKGEEQKENVELNNKNNDNENGDIMQAPSPAPEPAIRSTNFYSGSGNPGANTFDSLFSPQPVTTFSRKQKQQKSKQPAKGAAVISYWDKPITSGGNWADKASNIISASGIEEQRHRRNYEEEEDADLRAAIEASKLDQQNTAGGGGGGGEVTTPAAHGLFKSFKEDNVDCIEEEEEFDADLATALKRSLEEQQYLKIDEEEQKKGEVIDLGETVTPVKTRPAAGVENDGVATEEQQKEAVENTISNMAVAVDAYENAAATDTAPRAPPVSSPIPEIVEDDAKIDTEDGTNEELPVVALPQTTWTSTPTPTIAAKHALANYQLTAVISHHGSSAESGHFTADTRNSTTGQWYRFNDAQVHRIRGDAATNEMRERDCYMLFYTISSS